MSPPEADVSGLFAALESNRQQEVGDAKAKLQELLASVKDAWVVAGFVNYYLSTGSVRIVDVLVKAPVPHDRHLCDKLCEGLRGSPPTRLSALGLLGHVVRRQPSWLHRIVAMPLFKELLGVLRGEREVVPLVSGLLSLITLLPMIPTLLGPHLADLFAVFARLAAWDDFPSHGHKEHLQLALYGLFQNLYGMFPCNFVDFLRREYNNDDNAHVFIHTVRPMLDTVKMHPSLITANKSAETDGSRWKKMEHHDVLVECRRFSSERSRDDRSFRSRCGTDVSSLARPDPKRSSSHSTPNLTDRPRPLEPGAAGWFSLYEACGASSTLSAPQTPLPNAAHQDPTAPAPSADPQRDGGSPPEAAIEATPENTPVKDGKPRFNFPANSPAVRTLTSRLNQPPPSHSQPPSPLKKEPSPFDRADADDDHRRDAHHAHNKLHRVLHDRSQPAPPDAFFSIPSPQKRSAGSPLRRPPHGDAPDSPVPIGAAAPASGTTEWPLARPKPRRDCAASDAGDAAYDVDANRDDGEIVEINRRSEVAGGASRDVPLFADAEFKSAVSTRHRNDRDNQEEGDERWAEDEATCEADHRCTERKHGLHMPHSTTVLYYHATKRSRFLSQCITDAADGSDSASGVESDNKNEERALKNVKKSSSWPDIKRAFKELQQRTSSKIVFNVKEKKVAHNYQNGNAESFRVKKVNKHVGIQTLDVWPFEYEHLFTNILRNSCDIDSKDESVPMPEDHFEPNFSPYTQIDRYIEILTQNKSPKLTDDKKSPRDEIGFLKQQLELTHLELLYERHRREVHAFRNRRLLGRSRKNRATEEQNASLNKQISQLTGENEDLRQQVIKQKQVIQAMEAKQQESNKYWQHQLNLREAEVRTEQSEKERLSALLLEQRTISNESSADVQNLHAHLFDVSQQLQRAIRKSEMGDRQIDCIKRMQRELIMCGERDIRYKEIINALPSKTDLLVGKLTQQYKEQLVNTQSQLQIHTSRMEYLQSRETDLEATVQNKETVIQELKKQIRLIKEEYSEKLRSVEDKYQSVKRANQRLEAYCLELLQRVPQSPQTISRDLTSGFSPQSSPLSASLASSEGHGPLLASKVDEIKNLQVIVNETIEESLSHSLNNSMFEDDAH